jgi:hypothetical protein
MARNLDLYLLSDSSGIAVVSTPKMVSCPQIMHATFGVIHWIAPFRGSWLYSITDSTWLRYLFPPLFFFAPNLTEDGIKEVEGTPEEGPAGWCYLSSHTVTTCKTPLANFVAFNAIPAVPASCAISIRFLCHTASVSNSTIAHSFSGFISTFDITRPPGGTLRKRVSCVKITINSTKSTHSARLQ